MLVIQVGHDPGTHEALTIDATAGGVGITATIRKPTSGTYSGKPAQAAFLGPLETAQIRWTIDGTAPTALVGHLLEVGQTLTLDNPIAVANLKGFRTGGSSGVLPVTCFF